MKTVLLNNLVKEALQLVRTPAMVAILILCPVVTVGLVPFGLGDKTMLRVEVVDRTFTDRGLEAVSLLARSPYVKSVGASNSESEAEKKLKHGETDAVVTLSDGGEATITVNGAHTLHAANAEYYIENIISPPEEKVLSEIHPHPLYLSCDDNTHYYLVSMIIMLTAIVGCCLSALSVVREMETKVLEHLRSTGMKALAYVTSKVAFYVCITLLELIVALIIARVVFGLDPAGPLIALFILFACFLFAMVNLGVTFAAGGKNMARAIYLLVFVFLILILLSTMFAPLDNMSPAWAATRFVNPFFWGIDGAMKIMLKGVGISGVFPHICILLAIGGLLFTFNVVALGKVE